MADRKVFIWLSLKNASQVAGGVKRLAGGFVDLGRRAVGVFRGIGSSLLSLKSLIIGGLVYGAFRMLRSAITDVVGEYAKQEDAVRLLNVNLQSQGNYSAYLTQRLQDQANALQKVTRFGDDAIINGQAMLASYGATAAQIEAMTPIILNFAEATGQDAASAFDLAGKASTGYTSMLSRYGIIIDESVPKTEKFHAAMAAMAQRGGRAAEERAKTTTGALAMLGNQWSDLKEQVGAYIATSPALQGVFASIKENVAAASAWLDKHKESIQKLVDEGIGRIGAGIETVISTAERLVKDGSLKSWIEEVGEAAKTTWESLSLIGNVGAQLWAGGKAGGATIEALGRGLVGDRAGAERAVDSANKFVDEGVAASGRMKRNAAELSGEAGAERAGWQAETFAWQAKHPEFAPAKPEAEIEAKMPEWERRPGEAETQAPQPRTPGYEPVQPEGEGGASRPGEAETQAPQPRTPGYEPVQPEGEGGASRSTLIVQPSVQINVEVKNADEAVREVGAAIERGKEFLNKKTSELANDFEKELRKQSKASGDRVRLAVAAASGAM